MAETKADIARRLRKGIDLIYHGQFDKIMIVLCSYYSIITVSHFFFIAPDIRSPVMAGSGFAALVSGTTLLLYKLGKISPAASHAAYIPAGLSSLAAIYSHIFIAGDQLQLTNGVVITFAFAFTTISRRVFTGIFFIGTVLYIWALVTVPGPYLVHLAFMYFSCAALTVLCFVLRFRTVYSMERVLISNRSKASKLVEASQRIKEEMMETQRAAEEAKRANATKDVFVANATHELRTPLTGVLGMLDLLEGTELGNDQQDAVNAARFSAQTLLVVVNDLLDIAKLDAGKLELKPVPFSPATVVLHTCELLRTKAEAKNLSLTIEGLDREDMPVIGDPVRIGQVLLNLLDNAIKFTEVGGVIVSYSLDYAPADEDSVKKAMLEIKVQDTGSGFDAEEAEKLFSRFEQLEDSATRHVDGAGLGLSISRGLAEQMGGTLKATGEKGVGAVFSFCAELPVVEDLAGVDLSIVSRPAALAIAAGAKPGAGVVSAKDGAATIPDAPHLLLAEDNAVNQLLVQKLASKFGWSLDIVDDGAEAVRCVSASEPYDLILMDIRMPKMDGMEATRAIRALESEKAKVPIIALTANTGEESEARYLEAGMNMVVGKPINSRKLKESVEACLQLHLNEDDWAQL